MCPQRQGVLDAGTVTWAQARSGKGGSVLGGQTQAWPCVSDCIRGVWRQAGGICSCTTPRMRAHMCTRAQAGRMRAITGFRSSGHMSRPQRPGMPANQHAVPANQHAVPANQHAVPANQHAVPTNQHAVPANQHAVPTNQHAVPTNQHAVPTV